MVQGESVGLSGIHEGILRSILTGRAELNGLEARRSTLLKQVAGLSAASVDLKKKSYGYDRLQREVIAKKDALALYNKKAEEARISNAMDERKFGNVSLLEKAALPLPPAGFAFSFIVLMTVFASIAIALAVAFGIEHLSTTLRNESDVEEQVGLPVLATSQYVGAEV